MTDESYKYDVAFSFLTQDESLATRLNDLLESRLSTFLYSKRQKELAGTDGEESFVRVFGSEARLVVVLYRDGWGDKGWTRVEKDGIRNRAYENGYDFTLFIVLEKGASLPAWLPKQRLYYGLNRYGEEGVLAVIETRVQEAGGQTREESFEERAARLNREVVSERERKQFLRSGDGVAAAREAVKQLHDELGRRAEVVKSAGFELGLRSDTNWISITCGDFGLSVDWHLHFGNSLEESELEMALWRGPPPRIGDIFPFSEPKRLSHREFQFDRDHAEHGWRENGKSQFLSTERLAELCITNLLEKVHTDAKKP